MKFLIFCLLSILVYSQSINNYNSVNIDTFASFNAVLKDSNTITFTITSSRTGWLGIGLGSRNMKNVDMMTAEFLDSNTMNVYDVYSKGDFQPPTDVSLGGKDDFTNKVFSYKNGIYSVTWDRLLKTNDPFDYTLTTGKNITISYAFSSGDVASYHGSNFGTSTLLIDTSGKISFGTVQASSKINFYQIKGVVMIISWIFLNFLGVFYAAYMRHVTYWVHVHRICSGGAALLTIASGIYSIIDTNKMGRSTQDIHVAHRILGITIIILSAFLLIFGNIIYWIETGETLKSGWIHKAKFTHKYAGILCILLCLAEVGIGTNMTFELYGIVIALIIVYFTSANFFKTRQVLRENNKILLLKQINEEGKKAPHKIYSKSQLQKLKQAKKIVFMDNFIVDVTDYIEHHPGGQIHLIETLNHDVSRYLDATSAINPDFDPHDHLISTYQHILDKMVVGVIQDNSGLILGAKNENEVIDEIMTLISTSEISKETKEFKFSPMNKYPNYSFSRFIPGIEFIGKHFAVSSVSLNKTRYYSVCLCLNKFVKEKHLIILKNVERIEKKEEIVSPNINEEELKSDCLELYIKRYNFKGALSLYLHDLNPHTEELIIRGPIGLGLDLDMNDLDGTYVAFGGGTGVFCFLDFVAFTMRYLCHKISSKIFKENNNNINNEDFSSINDNFKLIYFSSFSDEESVVYHDICEELQKLNENYKMNVFNFYPRISTKDKRWEKDYIKDILMKEKRLKNVYVCGPTGFLTDIKKILLEVENVNPLNIHLV